MSRTSRLVLIVDDAAGDRALAQRAIAHAQDLGPITVAEAIDGIRGLASMRATVPDLVLLDINMPGMDGLRVLAAMRKEAALADVAVVLLSTSESDGDVAAGYRAGANAYVCKPMNWDAYQVAVASAVRFFLQTAVLPRRT